MNIGKRIGLSRGVTILARILCLLNKLRDANLSHLSKDKEDKKKFTLQFAH